MIPQKSQWRDEAGALPASPQKFLRGRQLQVVTATVKCLAPAPQHGQGAHLSRDETPINFMLPLLSCQAHKTNTRSRTPQQLYLLSAPSDHQCLRTKQVLEGLSK